jgi:multiple sugar transport system substrate-binding protein
MNTRRKMLFMISALLAMSLLGAACAPAATPTAEIVKETVIVEEQVAIEKVVTTTPIPAGPVTITFWHGYNPVETEFLDETVIPAFESAHPNIKVETLSVPYDDFRRKLVTSLAGGTPPDLARLDIIWVSEFGDMGALAKIGDVMSDFNDFAEAVFPGPLSTNMFRGDYYGLPLDTNTRVLAYHNGVFVEAGVAGPPTTMDEFLSACEKIKALGADRYCFADGGTYPWAVNPWIWSFGGATTDPNVTKASGYYNSANTAAAYEFLKGMIDDGYMHPGIVAGGLDVWGSFSKGEVAMILEGPWFPPFFDSQFPDVDYGLALMPAGDGGSLSVVGGEDIVIFEQSENKQAAAEFVRYMLSEETQLAMSEVGQMPVLKSLVESGAFEDHPFFGVFLEQLLTSRARLPHPAWPNFKEIVITTGGAILAGERPVQEALDDAAAQIDLLLGE